MALELSFQSSDLSINASLGKNVSIHASFGAFPLLYPLNFRSPGKIEYLWNQSYLNLYHSLSPYTFYSTNLQEGYVDQPFFYTYADEGEHSLSAQRKRDTRETPFISTQIDSRRISTFLQTRNGMMFITNQSILQTGNPFNETHIYDPNSAIAAASIGTVSGQVRPIRHKDDSPEPPYGTVGLSALADIMKSEGKGLIRGRTAERAKTNLEALWSNRVGLGMAKTSFQNSNPSTQDGIEARSDEGAYGLMIQGGKSRFIYNSQRGATLEFNQRWIGGGSTIRKNNEYTALPSLIIASPIEGVSWFVPNSLMSSLPSIQPLGHIGYTIEESPDSTKPGVKYGNSVGKSKDPEFGSSDIIVQYSYYASEKNNYPTKKSDKGGINREEIENYNESLQRVINNIRQIGNGKVYFADPPTDSRVISGPTRTKEGYNRLFSTTQGQDRKRNINPKEYPLGVLSTYRDSKTTMTDENLKFSGGNSYKLPTNKTFDAINTLEVLKDDKAIKNSYIDNWKVWEPYKDDLVALYFYDVVNKKYIPFRTVISGLSEALNSSWEELQFIGRPDRIYSYGGFTRNLTLNVKVVVNSIIELFPVWQRINYICTACKPSNYTTAADGGIMNRFMVPPMFMLTLGDMYRDQPVLFTAITVNVPDDAAWETLNEDNYTEQAWDYLSKIIKASSMSLKYGQLPREVELGFSMTLLEKERAIVGGANFGHAPRNEDWSAWNKDTIPNPGDPKKLHQGLVVNVFNQCNGTVKAAPASSNNPVKPSNEGLQYEAPPGERELLQYEPPPGERELLQYEPAP
jgi:hypothetical protein